MRRLTLVLTWLLVTAGATAVAWTTVGHLTPGAGGRAAPALSANAVDAALRSATGSAAAPTSVPSVTVPRATEGDGSGAGAPAAAPPPASPPACDDAGVHANGSATPAPAGSRPPVTRAPAPAPTTVPSPERSTGGGDRSGSSSGPGSGSSSPSTTTTAAPSRSAVVQSTGGVLTVSCSGSTIALVSSSPRSGYTQEIDDAGPQQVSVKYRSSEHESEIQVVCQNGSPAAQVNESGEH